MSRDVNFQPQADYILFDPIPQNMTEGGIALPEGANPDPPKARIVKAGPGRYSEEGVLMPMNVAEGDVVYMMFAYQQPAKITLGGKEYGIARARDVIGKANSPARPAAAIKVAA